MSGFQARSVFKNAYRSDIIRLVLICGGLFVLLWFIEITFLMTEAGTGFFYTYFKNPLLLPLEISEFSKQPWSIVSFGLLDANFWSLFTNMIWLWVFGSVIEDLKGTNWVLPIFWLGFIFAGGVLLLVNSFTPLDSGLYMSTLAGVASVAAAAMAYKPKTVFYSIFNKGVPIYFFGILFLVMTVFIHWQNINTLVFFVSGAFFGFLSQNLLHQPFQKIQISLANLRSFVSSNDNFIKEKSINSKRASDSLNQRLQQVLQKLNAHGFESLTEEENELLRFHNKI